MGKSNSKPKDNTITPENVNSQIANQSLNESSLASILNHSSQSIDEEKTDKNSESTYKTPLKTSKTIHIKSIKKNFFQKMKFQKS